MAYSYWVKRSYASLQVALPQMMRALVESAPSYTIIDSYSQNAGSPHDTPTDAADIDSLDADNRFRTSPTTNINVNYYMILRSSSSTFKWQIGFEYQDATTLRIILAPKEGWDVALNDADMTTAGNWDNAKLTTVDIVVPAGVANYSLVSDADHFKFIVEDGTTYAFVYVGKLDSVHTGDDYSACIYTATGTLGISSNAGLLGNNYRILSDVNDSTDILAYGLGANYQGAVGDLTTSAANQYFSTAASEYRLMPVYVHSATAGHIGTRGVLRDMFFTSQGLSGAGKGTLGGLTYVYFSNAAGSSPTVFNWDGLTTP